MARLRPIVIESSRPEKKHSHWAVPRNKTMDDPQGVRYTRSKQLKGIDGYVEMNIRPLPDTWNEDCVWIRCGKIERRVKRENLHKYPDYIIINRP